jgi:hypothetical protein
MLLIEPKADPTMADVTVVDPRERTLDPGTRVEVRNRFDGRWARGFVVDAIVGDGYRIRRSSDRTLVPSTFTADEVRQEHKRGQWWY